MEVVVKKALQVLTLVPLLLLTASYPDCVGRQAVQSPCGYPPCEHVVHIDTSCNPVDDNGQSLDSLSVHVGDRVCYVNDSGCTVKLKFNAELFSETSVRLDDNQCRNFGVLSTGRGNTYSYEIMCDCPEGTVSSGRGSGNPEVRVEEEDEEEEP
jgi:hypothetical protein